MRISRPSHYKKELERDLPKESKPMFNLAGRDWKLSEIMDPYWSYRVMRLSAVQPQFRLG